MSRTVLTCSFLLALSSIATADRAAEPHFAQPPSAGERLPPEQMPHIMPPELQLDRDSVRRGLVIARHANLARFSAYQKKGVFPSNTYQNHKLNVWRDSAGNFCAAATMIRMSGEQALVTKVAEQNNFIKLADVTQGPLMDWILTSGLTQAEIAAIQEPFMPVERPHQLQVVTVDPKLREAEDARLRAKYRAVEKMLQANEKASIELAVDRLMKHPTLAWHVAVVPVTEG